MIFSGFRSKFQKIVTCVAFSIKFAKTNQKFAENSEFCEKIHYLIYSKLFTSLLRLTAADLELLQTRTIQKNLTKNTLTRSTPTSRWMAPYMVRFRHLVPFAWLS